MELHQLVEALSPYEIEREDIEAWQHEFNLLPVSINGGQSPAFYEPYHISLFKNIKKHLMLGRTIPEIKRLLILPPLNSAIARPAEITASPISKANKNEVAAKTTTLQKVVALAHATAQEVQPTPTVLSKEPFFTNDDIVDLTQLSSFVDQQNNQDLITARDMAQDIKKYAEFSRIQTEEILEDTTDTSQSNISEIRSIYLVSPEVTADRENSIKRRARWSKAAPIKQKLKRLSTPNMSIEDVMTRQNVQNTVNDQSALLILVDRLVNDKDDLSSQVAELGRLNTHLNKVNTIYMQQIQTFKGDLNKAVETIELLEKQARLNERIQLLDDKSRLQALLIKSEQKCLELQQAKDQQQQEITKLYAQASEVFDAGYFVGEWIEQAELRQIHYDSFGVNLPKNRSRVFKLTYSPQRLYGSTAIIETIYDYRTNTMWKRMETMIVLYRPVTDSLQGELIIDYLLEGQSVAKASYSFTAERHS